MLCLHDEHREDRLANMALHFDLHASDLRMEKDLEAVAPPAPCLPVPALEEPFDSVLAVIYDAGRLAQPVTSSGGVQAPDPSARE